MASASGNIITMEGAQNRVGEVGRQASRNSTLPLGAAPPDRYSYSGGSVSASSSATPAPSNRRPLQVINPPMSAVSGSSSGTVPASSFIPLPVHELEMQPAWPEKNHARGTSSSSNDILSNDGQFQGRDGGGPSGSGGVPERTPEPLTGEPTDAPPAYVA